MYHIIVHIAKVNLSETLNIYVITNNNENYITHANILSLLIFCYNDGH